MFPRIKAAIFVDGCFWHQCSQHGTLPKTNAGWWREKLDANVIRDRAADTALAAAGWMVMRIWEHEDPILASDRVEVVVRNLYAGKGTIACG